jgi:RNA polymerase sigma-70 factor, ECF subfamily
MQLRRACLLTPEGHYQSVRLAVAFRGNEKSGAGVMPRPGDGSRDRIGTGKATDEELMLRVASGDELAFRRLSERYAAKSFALARRIVTNDDDAEEIVQEALLRVWTAAARWRHEAAFPTWFYRIIVNLCLNRRRQKTFAPLEASGDPVDPSASAIEQLERTQSDKIIAQSIAGLPERQKTVLILTYYEELSNADTATIMDTTVSSVESLLVRAKRALRAELAPLLDSAGEKIR